MNDFPPMLPLIRSLNIDKITNGLQNAIAERAKEKTISFFNSVQSQTKWLWRVEKVKTQWFLRTLVRYPNDRMYMTVGFENVTMWA